MSTFAYAYTFPDGTGKAARGLRSLTGTVRHLRRSLSASGALTEERAKQVAHVAANELGDAITEYGITALIIKEGS